MAVKVSARSGYDLEYMLKSQAGNGQEKTPGGYYMNAALAGEPAGRWYGAGAQALGFAPGTQVVPEPFRQVYSQVNPATGEHLGRKPGGYRKFAEIYARLLEAEPHATAERRFELEREAAQSARRSPLYTDSTASFDKSISVVHTSIRENARRAAAAKDLDAEHLWTDRERRWSEILQEAAEAGIEYMAHHAGWTRTGYHGRRVDGVEPGRWARALPVITAWLQGTNREGEPHDHVHVLWARMALTESDGKWRALDTMRLRGQLGAMAAVVSAYAESALTREFGVEWEARADGMGNEIKGFTSAWKRAFASARTEKVDARQRELARDFERKHGRAPNTREMYFLRNKARAQTKDAKKDEAINWDKFAEECDATVGGELASIADATLFARHPGLPAETPSDEAQEMAIRKAIDRIQREHSTWTRADLLKVLGWNCGPEFAYMDPAARLGLLQEMATRAISADFGVVCLEAPQWPPPPPSLRREYDGRSVYTAPGTERYATRGQLSLEEQLVERGRRPGAPFLSREVASARLGADASALDRVLHAPAHDATQLTQTGLRYDQAAMIYEAITSPARVSVGVGPAGSGKTHTVAAGAKAWEAAGGHVLGITMSQAARNVLHRAGIDRAENSTQFLNRIDRGDTLDERTLIVIDEGSTLSMEHLAKIVEVAERDNAKVMVTGDHQQLAAVEAGGGMNLLARRLGYTQLAQPVRFTQEWERRASLRLRQGDPVALDTYQEHGRITGGSRMDVFEEARQAYVASRIDGQDMLLMAYSREDCRTLSRMIRDDLIHLGYVDGGRAADIAEGAKASAGDIIVARKNDHNQVTDPGHTTANGDLFQVVRVTDHGMIVRRVLEADPETGMMRLADRKVRYRKDQYATTDLGYAVTGHNGMGGTVGRGEAVFTGGETREWTYVAMTRGRDRNTARVVTRPREADPRPGTDKDMELARYERILAEREGRPFDERKKQDSRLREPIGILADNLERDAGEEAASEYQRRQLVQADHLGLLHAQWADLTKHADRERYRMIVTGHLPEEHRSGDTSYSTWLYRTMKNAELAGVDVDAAVRIAVRQRSLEGSKDVHAVLDSRLRAMAGPMVPRPQGPYASRVPPVVDAERQQHLRNVAQAMDERKERIGEFAAETSAPWAVKTLGPVPDDLDRRKDWQKRASHIGGYREIYGIEGQADPIGPEPSGDSPEQRAAWHTAQVAITQTDTADVRARSDTSLWHMRGTYKAETEWAPRHVGGLLGAVRAQGDRMHDMNVRSNAEAIAAISEGDEETARQHMNLALSASAAEEEYDRLRGRLEEADADRRTWEQITAGPRRWAVAADAELRRRHPEQHIEPLKSAEPEPLPRPEHAGLTAEDGGPAAWLTRGAPQVSRSDWEKFREKSAERRNVRVPAEDHEAEDEGEAWPEAEADPDAILQPPPPEPAPSPQVAEAARQAGREPGELC